MITPQEVAQRMNGREYRAEIEPGEAEELLESGLVAIYGASDDLVICQGAWGHDEIDGYDNYIVPLNASGPIRNPCCEGEDCPNWRVVAEKMPFMILQAVFAEEGYTWIYHTGVPHHTFDIVETETEGATKYCRGIVFSVADLPEAPQ